MFDLYSTGFGDRNTSFETSDFNKLENGVFYTGVFMPGKIIMIVLTSENNVTIAKQISIFEYEVA